MRKLFAAPILLALDGCVGMMGPGPDPVATLESLRETQRGICAGMFAGPRLSAVAAIESCVQTGSPGTLYDSKKPFLKTVVRAGDFIAANPGSWKVTVTRDDGVKVVDAFMKDRVPEIGACSSQGCGKVGVSIEEASEPWRVGVYSLRYTFIHDVTKSAEMKITLTP